MLHLFVTSFWLVFVHIFSLVMILCYHVTTTSTVTHIKSIVLILPEGNSMSNEPKKLEKSTDHLRFFSNLIII